jgi:ribosomal protein L11 methyltransferase
MTISSVLIIYAANINKKSNFAAEMDYYEILFTCESSYDTAIICDILAAELGEIGFESFMQNPEGLVAYVPVAVFEIPKVEKCLAHFPLANVRFRYAKKIIEARDWNEVWEQNYFQPVRIDSECLIRAPFHSEESGFRFEIIIHPKMAFGTGNHETTHLMIRSMLALDLEGKEVLDMGCGTAVLAILAAKKGACRVVAIDIDEWAYNNALENCQLNNTPYIQVVLGGAGFITPAGMFDYIFANINRNILLNDISAYCQGLKPDGELYMSGFYKDDIPVIEAKCKQNGLSLLSCIEQNNWVVVRAHLATLEK